jgi:hypothetical protein
MYQTQYVLFCVGGVVAAVLALNTTCLTILLRPGLLEAVTRDRDTVGLLLHCMPPACCYEGVRGWALLVLCGRACCPAQVA